MGYTHYWYQKRDASAAEWGQITAAARQIIGLARMPLALEYDAPNEAPIVNADEIRFNGVGERGHETFHLTAQKQNPRIPVDDGSTFNFCKTAYKPYDAVVCAILIAVHHYAPEAWRILSDGDEVDWRPALGFVKAATAVEMALPFSREDA